MIGIFGGTFDPIHNGHLVVATSIAQLPQFSEIKLIPCKVPVHKDLAMATEQQRIKMIELAIVKLPKLTIDLREIRRTTPSFMIDTLRSLRQEFPDTPLVLIIGMDSFLNLPTWHEWRLLINYAHLLVVSRPEVELQWSSELKKIFKSKQVMEIARLTQNTSGNIYFHAMNSLNLSATHIRDIFRRGKLPTQWLPKSVLDYIIAEKIYLN